MNLPSDLEVEFHRRMVEIYQRALHEAAYPATRFLQMISTPNSGLAAAKTLLGKSEVSDGFTHLWEKERLDLTVEHLVLEPQFDSLFSDEERALARKRLLDVGWQGD